MKVAPGDRARVIMSSAEVGFVPVPIALFSKVIDVLEAIGPALGSAPHIEKGDDKLFGTDEMQALYRRAVAAEKVAMTATLQQVAADGLKINLPSGYHLVEDEKERVAADGTVRKAHYGDGRQPWDVIKEKDWAPEFAAGNALKYIRRAAAKNGADDIKKARWYFKELKRLADSSDDGVYDELLEELTPDELAILKSEKEWTPPTQP